MADSTERRMALLAEAAGIDFALCEIETREKLFKEVLRFAPIQKPHPWKRPREIEDEIDGIRSDIRRLRQRIEALDGYAMSLARIEADRGEQEAALQAIIDAGNDRELIADALSKLREHGQRPQEQWVDRAALRHLEALEAALVYPAERAISRTMDGSGRPRNLDAYEVALAAAVAFQNLTGTRPGYWNGGRGTPFSRLVEALFADIGIDAHPRKPIEWAMTKLPELE